ncbi:SCAN domain-containing protein 3 [Thelohanellus kitauei]|uniref:SCAN domain-containing protein 3 n=1 Tax=Thelohanellus kitauei TaxID=669202 RepID=A0A0C2IIG2_THEKT|nr:SCAN domain-containing protein 3 [Thelohanellus kitauei]
MLTNLCVVCLQTLSNDAMKKAKLEGHLTTMHSELASQPKEYFERHEELYLKKNENNISPFCERKSSSGTIFGYITNSAFQKTSQNFRRAHSTSSSRHVLSHSRKGIQSKA